MFGHCIWYTLHREHPINRLIHHLALRFKTDAFNGHVSVCKQLGFRQAMAVYTHHGSLAKPWFKLYGDVYQTCTGEFYALERCCKMYDINRLNCFHVSLAYRVGAPFTTEEIEVVKTLVPADVVWSSDMYLALVDCTAKHPRHWKYVKRSS